MLLWNVVTTGSSLSGAPQRENNSIAGILAVECRGVIVNALLIGQELRLEASAVICSDSIRVIHRVLTVSLIISSEQIVFVYHHCFLVVQSLVPKVPQRCWC